MAVIEATLLGIDDKTWRTGGVFIACSPLADFKYSETVIHPKVAKALGIHRDGAPITAIIGGKRFNFRTNIRYINCDFWISYNPLLVVSKDLYNDEITLRHGKRAITHVEVPASFDSVVFGSGAKKPPINWATIYFDGCCKGNPGYGGYGYCIYSGDSRETQTDNLLAEGFAYLTDCTSNVSEYRGLIEALAQAKRLNVSNLIIKGDSNLVLEQINGNYQVRSEKMIPLYTQVKQLLQYFESSSTKHILRHLNQKADALANKSLECEAPILYTKFYWANIKEAIF